MVDGQHLSGGAHAAHDTKIGMDAAWGSVLVGGGPAGMHALNDVACQVCHACSGARWYAVGMNDVCGRACYYLRGLALLAQGRRCLALPCINSGTLEVVEVEANPRTPITHHPPLVEYPAEAQ